MQIEYALIESTLGRLLVARTERGICAVYPGADDAVLERQLADEFPRAERQRQRKPFAEARQVRDAIDRDTADIPGLDLNGTDFQRRVWAALSKIPSGEIRTYAEVAKSIGQDGASRAVARACATNNLAVLVPCHRVVRGDGGVGGYRWGVERKEMLLSREATSQGAKRPA